MLLPHLLSWANYKYLWVWVSSAVKWSSSGSNSKGLLRWGYCQEWARLQMIQTWWQWHKGNNSESTFVTFWPNFSGSAYSGTYLGSEQGLVGPMKCEGGVSEVCVCVFSRFSPVWLFEALWTIAHQAPLSMGFPRQEHWSGLSGPPPGDLSGTCLPCPLHCRHIVLLLTHWGSPSVRGLTTFMFHCCYNKWPQT